MTSARTSCHSTTPSRPSRSSAQLPRGANRTRRASASASFPTSRAWIPAPDEATWNVLPDDFLAQIKNLSVKVKKFSHVPYAKLKNLVALGWGPSDGLWAAPKAACVIENNMEHLGQLQSIFLYEHSMNSLVFEAITRHNLRLCV